MISPQNHNTKITSPRVVVRPYIPWHLRLFAIAVLICLLAALSWGMYIFGSKSAKTQIEDKQIDNEFISSYDPNACQKMDKNERCSLLTRFARKLQVDNTVHEDLTNQIKLLGEENDRLKEELVYFQHIMSSDGDTTSGVSINRFDLAQGQSPRQYRYTLLLTQGGQRPKDFEGSLKFLVTLHQNTQKTVVALTSDNSSKLFPVNFKHYKKIEKSFQVPENAVVENIQVQVFEKGNTKAKLTQTVKLSS